MKTIEQLEKSFTDKLDALAGDVKKDVIDAARADLKEWISEQKKNAAREFTTNSGMDQSKQSEFVSTMRAFGTNDGKLRIPENKEFQLLRGIPAHVVEGLAGYVKAVWCQEHNKDMPSAVVKALGEQAGATGGFLVPYEFRPELLRLIIEDQVVRPRARVVPMATDTLWYPKIVDTTHATTIHGGVKGTWAVEGSDLSSVATGDPSFGQFQLIAKKFSDYVKVANELIMDSPISIMPLLAGLLREGLGFFEDKDMLTGSGAGKVKGISASGSLISVTRTKTSHVVYDDIRNMQVRLFPSSYARATWVCSPAVLGELLNMSIAVGTGGSAVMITNVSGQTAADAFPMRIFGRPLVISEKMANLGTAFDLLLADFSYYIVGDRMDLSITTSEHAHFANDQTGVRVIERLDGAPWIDSPLTPNNGGDTLSGFITLAA